MEDPRFNAVNLLKKLLVKEGGEAKRKILKYLATHEDVNVYEIAKEVFGDGVKYHKNTALHLKQLKKVKGLLSSKRRRGRVYVSLTDYGRSLCRELGISLPTSTSQKIVDGLNMLCREPLTKEEVNQALEILTEDFLELVKEYLEGHVYTHFYYTDMRLALARLREMLKGNLSGVNPNYPGGFEESVKRFMSCYH
jgi:hypothetical protein